MASTDLENLARSGTKSLSRYRMICTIAYARETHQTSYCGAMLSADCVAPVPWIVEFGYASDPMSGLGGNRVILYHPALPRSHVAVLRCSFVYASHLNRNDNLLLHSRQGTTIAAYAASN